MKKGKVYLVGAGPGDPGLITVKGMECLKRAEVVVYDHLLDEELLANVGDETELIYAGKRASQHALEQQEINAVLVAKGKEGKVVVRLKGGDPFVLGRGGEEGEALRAEGIDFDVVPGVTSAVAVPAYAGIPVTHRGLASSFAVITGHEDPTKETSSLNWQHLSRGVDTLVFLMGTQNIKEIADRLMSNGRKPTTPAAVVCSGTRPSQRTVTGTLDDISSRVKAAGITPPAIIVVGEVVRMKGALDWFESRPLLGKRVLVTRARHQASTMTKLLKERGAEAIELPLIEIEKGDGEELGKAISRLPEYDWILFTSVNGVERFFDKLTAAGNDARELSKLKIGAIGPATAEALRNRCLTPDFVPSTFTSEGIIEDMRNMAVSGKRFLLPRADIADNSLVRGLEGLGSVVDEVAAYHTSPAPESSARVKELVAAGAVDVITFASSSTVSNFIAAAGHGVDLHEAKVACIGPKTAETARNSGLNVDIMAQESTIPSLVEAIEQYFRKEK